MGLLFVTPDAALGVWLSLVPALALAIDRSLGEPPVRWHPVVWMGHYLTWAGMRCAPRADAPPPGRHARAFWLGALAWCVGAAIVGGAAWQLQAWLLRLPDWATVLLLALLLKPLLAWALLHDEVLAVEQALAHSLADGRVRLARLVSRGVDALTEAQVRESAIESLAENLNDSLVAPMFWFALLGLPGAALFRFANTADAMWGYRGTRVLGGVARDWRRAGTWAARADDVLAWLPARITAVLVGGLGALQSWRHLPGEARRTPSPNSGWPMAAMALVLGVRLGKSGVYTLGEGGRDAAPRDLLRACRIGSRAAIAATLLACAALMLRAAPW
ncbi:MAG: adenosylcobinamide-phosphate synthase CbiB [Comamonas sp.]|nr:adenosylcobinamide-phosphate synthase CbiB [Comamonas sp.]